MHPRYTFFVVVFPVLDIKRHDIKYIQFNCLAALMYTVIHFSNWLFKPKWIFPRVRQKTRHSGPIWQRYPESCQERVVVMMLLLWIDLFCWLISASARSENTSRNTLSTYKDNTVCNPQAGFRGGTSEGHKVITWLAQSVRKHSRSLEHFNWVFLDCDNTKMNVTAVSTSSSFTLNIQLI